MGQSDNDHGASMANGIELEELKKQQDDHDLSRLGKVPVLKVFPGRKPLSGAVLTSRKAQFWSNGHSWFQLYGGDYLGSISVVCVYDPASSLRLLTSKSCSCFAAAFAKYALSPLI
jgi:hypothetical protein